LAERLVRQSIGSVWRFRGFLATPIRGKNVVFHIQEFEQDLVQEPGAEPAPPFTF